MRLTEEIHNTLNPKIWDDYRLKPEVRDKILEIVDYFIDNLQIPLSVADVQLCGSNASYNYTENSDMDVHIIVNFDLLDAPTPVLQALYTLEKSKFNSNYDVSIHGVPVELYVQDINSSVMSNGIYSVTENEWIKQPVPIDVEEPDVTEQVNEFIQTITQLQHEDEIEEFINSLYLLRQNSLNTSGEFSEGNLIFKKLRDLGYLQQLKDKLHKIKEQDLSLESLQELFIGH